jgi:serine/threonine protein kinase
MRRNHGLGGWGGVPNPHEFGFGGLGGRWNPMAQQPPNASNRGNKRDTHPEFTTIKRLGAGQRGSQNQGVYIVKHKSSGEKCIEKRIPGVMIEYGQAQREVNAMQQLKNHTHIVSLKTSALESYHLTGYGSIFMQHCELGSLEGLIDQFRKHGKSQLDDEGFLYKVLWDVGHALCYMATGVDKNTAYQRAREGKSIDKVAGWNSILHRDLKPGNIFITRRDVRPGQPYPSLVVGDLGLNVRQSEIDAGTARKPGDRASGFTPMFAPPEAPKYHVLSDMYCLGVTVHCLAIMSNNPMDDKRFRETHPLARRFADEGIKQVVRHCLSMIIWNARIRAGFLWMCI